MDVVVGNEPGLGDSGSASLYNKELRLSITREDIEEHARLLVNAFERPVLVDTMRI
jgi:hypothetical protein